MKIIEKTRIAVVAVAAIAIVFCAVFMVSSKASANPSYMIQNSTSSLTSDTLTATSSVAWQTAGTATTTVALNGSIGTSQAMDSATLFLYRTGAGGTTKTNIAFEYSPNCNASVPDWYSYAATSTMGATVTAGSAQSITWAFASSTTGGAGSFSNTDSIAIPVPTPSACVRAVLTVPTGAASSSIWAEFVGKRQNN